MICKLLLICSLPAVILCNSIISKRDVDDDLKWEQIGKDVCFHGNNDAFGVVMLKKTGFLKALKLVYLSGGIQCSASEKASNWGCADQTKLNVFVTDEKKEVIFPPRNEVTLAGGNWYTLPGTISTASDLVFKNFCYPTYVRSMDHLQVWWGEDLINHGWQGDNSGKTCVNVFAVFATPSDN